MASTAPPQPPMHPPYPLSTARLGGVPVKSVDVPITCVFLVLFVCTAVAHMTILQVNRRRGRKFLLSGMLFGFCMARITSCVMLIVWAEYPKKIKVAIAAQIFVAAGVILIFIINLIFTQRVIRATFPHWAWKKWFSIMFKAYYASIVVMLIALITSIIQSFYSLNTNTRRIDRDILRFGGVYFAVAAFLPLPILSLKLFLPTRGRVEKFGEGRFRTKIMVLMFASTILTLGASFRAGTNFVPRPSNNPAWYHSKACFYIFNFTIEWIVLALYVIVRVDKRFIIPNGSHAPGHYVNGVEKISGEGPSSGDMALHDDEEQVFYDADPNSSDTAMQKDANQHTFRSNAV